MKKNIFRVLRILIFIVSVSSIFLLYINNKVTLLDTRTEQSVGYRRDENKDLDCVIFGDSNAEADIIPFTIYKEAGLKTYNSGEIDCKINRVYSYIKDMYKYQTPKLIIIETDTLLIGSTQKSKECSDEIVEGNFIEKLKNHDQWRYRNRTNETIENKGFRAMIGNIKYNEGNAFFDNNPSYHLDDNTMSILTEIIQLTKDKGTKLLFVSIPTLREGNRQFQEELKTWISNHNLNLLDFNFPNSIYSYRKHINTATDFCDLDHLNVSGAYKVSLAISNYIKDKFNYNINNKNDSYYYSANKFYNKYKKNFD